MYIQFTIVCNL